MLKLGIALFFLTQNILRYALELDVIFSANRLLIPFGVYCFADLFLNIKTHTIIKLLGIFLCYVGFQTIFTSSSDIAIGFLFSDEGGLLTYLSVGLLASMGLNEASKKNYNFLRIRNQFSVVVFILLLIFINIIFIQSIFSLEALFNRISGIRFSMETDKVDYQVIGDAYILIFYIVTAFLASMYSKMHIELKRKAPPLDIILIIILYISGVLASQILGSNASTVMLLAFGIIFCSFARSSIFNSTGTQINFYTIYLKPSFYILFVAFIFIFLLVATIFALDLDNAFKFLNYDEGSLLSTSILNRLALYENFLVTWDVSPIFGSMQSDLLVHMPGKYAHSLPLSLLSHSGIIGFIMFFYLLFKLSSIYLFQFNLITNKFEIINRFLILTIILFAFLATFWAWPPVWFAVGFIIGSIDKKI